MTEKNIFKMFNETTRKMETIEVEDAELLPGQKVIKMFFCNLAGRYVTVPGASIFQVNSNLELELTND